MTFHCTHGKFCDTHKKGLWGCWQEEEAINWALEDSIHSKKLYDEILLPFYPLEVREIQIQTTMTKDQEVRQGCNELCIGK